MLSASMLFWETGPPLHGHRVKRMKLVACTATAVISELFQIRDPGSILHTASTHKYMHLAMQIDG